MKIDIHTHTRKCKSGDRITREISPDDFCQTILGTDVRIIAITNHNTFDHAQFEQICARMGEEAQVWPGIEIDVVEGGERGHLLVITSPTVVKEFSSTVEELTKGSTPDSFTATIRDVLENFDALNPLYVAHYKQKRPSLTDDMLETLEKGAKNACCILKEVTNSISAGIHISHGRSSIYGSDVHDWAKYRELASDLPELRLPVDSFEHFCLLLQKDAATINTLLDRKTSEELQLSPFGDGRMLAVKVFNDINVIFGPKGTGKSCILKAIAKSYSDRGIDAKVYESASDRIEELYDVKGKDLAINLNTYGINYCTDEIQAVRNAGEVDITSISKYFAYFKATHTNANAKKLLLKDIDAEEESSLKRTFLESNKASLTTEEFLRFLDTDPSVKNELNAEELKDVVRILGILLERLTKSKWTGFAGWKAVALLNSAIKSFRKGIERNTGTPAKPITAGFRDYAMNRVKVEVALNEILKSVSTKIPAQTEFVGSLGVSKGDLSFITEFNFQSGAVSDGSMISLTAVKKNAQKKFINCIRTVQQRIYSDDLFQHISALNEIDDIEAINTVNELLLFKRYFTLQGDAYSPSSGEASMVMLQKELELDKDVYILDEPERSLGNEYINDVIVPLIKDRARAGKKIFISTHDANIAVRTLPYCSIYRRHDSSGYSTFIGNPFANNLVNVEDKDDLLDWKAVSMRTLEGGRNAFGERGKIYGDA